ncbi:Trafficking protein particle complex subunit 6B [Plasmodiophora brassicae]
MGDLTKLIRVVVLVVAVMLEHASVGHVILPYGGSAGNRKQASSNVFDRGFSTGTDGHVAQATNENRAQAYDRANVAQNAFNTAEIGVAGLGGAGSTGTNSRALSANFDRGALLSSAAGDVVQHQGSSRTARDSAVRNAALDTGVALNGPYGASFGRSAKSLFQNDQAARGSAAHLGQSLVNSANSDQVFDQGAVNRASYSRAVLGQGLGGVGSAGESQDAYSAVLNRGRLSKYARRGASNVANDVHQAGRSRLVDQAASDTASIFGGGGGSHGSTDQRSHVASAGSALDHADSAQSLYDSAGHSNLLDSQYAKGARGSSVVIGAGLPGGVSSGTQYSSSAAGYDRRADVGNANSAATRSSAATTTAFDNNVNDNRLHATAAIGVPYGAPMYAAPAPYVYGAVPGYYAY